MSFSDELDCEANAFYVSSAPKVKSVHLPASERFLLCDPSAWEAI